MILVAPDKKMIALKCAFMLLSVLIASISAFGADKYGGDPAHPCPAGSKGHFYLYKDAAAKHWFFCDPDGNRYFMIGIQVFDASLSAGYDAIVNKKYGPNVYPQLVRRFRSLGFNTITEFASLHALPVPTIAGTGNTALMPFVYFVNPTYYNYFSSMPQKDLIEDQPPAFKGWRAGGFPDVWDRNWATHVAADLGAGNHDFPNGIATLNGSPWCIGITVDDSDNLEGFKDGPAGPNPSPHDGWLAGVASPYRIFSKKWGVVFSDTTLHLKAQWQGYLQGKYSTISALNSAWGANYTTFGSTASTVASESIGTGNGSTSSFSMTLSHRPVDLASLGVYVGGVLQGGDCPWPEPSCGGPRVGRGNIFGLHTSAINGGSIVYSSGAVTIAFSTPPAVGTAISVSYQYGGWPKQSSGGTGLLDEDGSSSWWPSDSTLPNTGTPVTSDLDTFLGQIAQQYFKTIHNASKANNPNHLIMSGDALHSWTRATILAQEGKYMDAAILAGAEPPTRDSIAIAAYYALGIPIIPYMVALANADSPTSAANCSNDWGTDCVATQQTRGQLYQTMGTGWFQDDVGADGYGFIVGWNWWQMVDNTSENMNFGLVTVKDNLYDGIQDRVAACTDPWGFSCGGEARNYGDFISYVKSTNQVWLQDGKKNGAAPNPR
jgi:hypothetical protein